MSQLELGQNPFVPKLTRTSTRSPTGRCISAV